MGKKKWLAANLFAFCILAFGEYCASAAPEGSDCSRLEKQMTEAEEDHRKLQIECESFASNAKEIGGKVISAGYTYGQCKAIDTFVQVVPRVAYKAYRVLTDWKDGVPDETLQVLSETAAESSVDVVMESLPAVVAESACAAAAESVSTLAAESASRVVENLEPFKNPVSDNQGSWLTINCGRSFVWSLGFEVVRLASGRLDSCQSAKTKQSEVHKLSYSLLKCQTNKKSYIRIWS